MSKFITKKEHIKRLANLTNLSQATILKVLKADREELSKIKGSNLKYRIEGVGILFGKILKPRKYHFKKDDKVKISKQKATFGLRAVKVNTQ